ANALDELFGEEDELPIETSSTQPPTPAPESKEDIPADAPQEEITPENLAEPEVSTPDNAPVDDLSNSEEDQPGVAASSMEEILGTEVPPTVAEPPSPHEAPIPLEDISSALFEDTPVVPQESEELSAEKNDVAEAIDSLLGEDEAPIEGHITSSGQISPEDTQASILEAPTIRASEEEGKNEETEKDENLGGDVSNALNDLFGAELDEDLSDLMDPPKQQPSPASTQTLADLYLSQGHPQDALQVLQDLDAREPGDPDIQAQIQDIQKRMDAGEFGQS
ncbi:MAG TPA: tetratricopeptide repeat protein, partial [Fibrobacteraceae bacterium]|nr:tetratricopeptide repeat protein [Fibrobacteraceae bacterium]